MSAKCFGQNQNFKHCSKFPTRVETMISLQWRLWRWRTSSWTGVPSFSVWSHFKDYHPDGQVQRCLSLRPQPSTTCGGRPLNCIEGCQVNAFRWWTLTILMRRCSRSVQLTGHISSPRDLFRWFYLTKKITQHSPFCSAIEYFQATTGHFWSMVWQRQSRAVIMLNRSVFEAGDFSFYLVKI